MTGVIREDAGSEWVFLCLQPCEEHLSSEGKGDHGNLSNEDICLFPLRLKSSHTKKNLCVCVCERVSQAFCVCSSPSGALWNEATGCFPFSLLVTLNHPVVFYFSWHSSSSLIVRSVSFSTPPSVSVFPHPD